MAYLEPRGRRPGILGLVTVASFILSVLNVIWVGVFALIALVIGGVSWLGGPIVGLAVTTVVAIVLLYVLAQSVLSLVLFAAAWKTWSGDPGGRSLHLIWAWIIVVLDVIDLVITGGMEPGAWVRLIYAGFVIWVMNRDDIRAYFDGLALADPRAGKPTGIDDWR